MRVSLFRIDIDISIVILFHIEADILMDDYALFYNSMFKKKQKKDQGVLLVDEEDKPQGEQN